MLHVVFNYAKALQPNKAFQSRKPKNHIFSPHKLGTRQLTIIIRGDSNHPPHDISTHTFCAHPKTNPTPRGSDEKERKKLQAISPAKNPTRKEGGLLCILRTDGTLFLFPPHLVWKRAKKQFLVSFSLAHSRERKKSNLVQEKKKVEVGWLRCDARQRE